MDSSTNRRVKVVVAGDVTIDLLIWPSPNESFRTSHNWTLYPSTRMEEEAGGALLLANMIRIASNLEIATYWIDKIERISSEVVLHSIAFLDTFPNHKNNAMEKVFRIKKYGGFFSPIHDVMKPIKLCEDYPDADIVILDDAGNGFRNIEGVWPKSILLEGKYPIVILKMGLPLFNGELWKHLIEKHLNNLILIINATDFINLGINIRRQQSWEQTAEDFYWQIVRNPYIKSIATCNNLILRFGLEGAIHYKNKGGNLNLTLYYDPYFGEGEYNEQYEGDMQGISAAFVSAFAAEVIKKGLDGIENGIYEGLKISRKLQKLGFGSANGIPHYPISELFKLENEKNTICKVTIPDFRQKPPNSGREWTILDERTRGDKESIAFDIVCGRTRIELDGVPRAKFGEMFIFNRDEIERFRRIKDLMKQYIEKKKSKTPLSIAVFGPPGSGKSLSVTQLAQSIDPDRVETIEFNLSQFTSAIDLTKAFHKIRDKIVEGKIPLVFFDEFDSSFEGELGWLKFFLAPMQDGVFKDGETIHPIGKSIFVFAGGINHTFKEFSRENFDRKLKEKGTILKKFKEAKGIDFTSRLRGYINVAGVNSSGTNDTSYILRRAFLLRSLLYTRAPQIFTPDGMACIDQSVIRGFLKVPIYKYDVRSMGAIIDMSMLSFKKCFDPTSLPPSEQLEIHVNSEIFLKIVQREILFNDAKEQLAKEIHEVYRTQQSNKNQNDPTMQPWELLREDFKESNCKQADAIPEKLRAIGLDFIPYIEKPEKPLRFSEDQVEFLAKIEHEKWIAERMEEGWKYGSPLDPEKKISPYLIPWSDTNLAEEVKDWDRTAVRKIPELLEKAGFELYPLQ